MVSATNIERRVAILATALALGAFGPSCRNPAVFDAGPGPDSGGSIDAGAGDDAGSAELDPNAVAATRAIVIAGSLTAPALAEAQALRDEGGRLRDGERENRTRTGVEDAISGNSVVTDPTCVSYAWSGLEVTATFTGCVLEASGESLDGAITLRVSFHPTTFTITLAALSVGAATVDGSLVLNVGGACGTDDAGCTSCPDGDSTCTEERAPQTTLTGELTVTDGGATTLSIEALTLTFDATGTTASGTGTLSGQSVTATDLFWAVGDCLPSSGTVTLGSTTLTFTASTPSTGEVEVRVGPIDAGTQALFTPCAA